MEGSINSDAGCDEENVLLNHQSDGDSLKDECQSSFSSWDSEPESDVSYSINGIPEESLNDGIGLEENYFDKEEQNELVEVENSDDGFVWEIDNRTYDELLKKFNENEEKLRATDLKLRLSEEENIKLKSRVEGSEKELENVREEVKAREEVFDLHKGVLVEEIKKLKSEVDNVLKEKKLKQKELHKQNKIFESENFKSRIQIKRTENELENMQKELNLKVEELQKQNAELDAHIPEYVHKITNLVEQLRVVNEQLKISNSEIAVLREKYDSKCFEAHKLHGELVEARGKSDKLECELASESNYIEMLEDMVEVYEANETNHQREIQNYISELLCLHEEFCSEKDQLNFCLDCVLEIKQDLSLQLDVWESRNNDLENRLRQCEAEKLEQMVLQNENKALREELGKTKHDVEVANKEIDSLMIKRNEVDDQMDILRENINSHNEQISNLKRCIRELKDPVKKLVVDYEAILVNGKNLKVRVEELEKEVTKQNGVISRKDEEKKEAIKQLCHSLEHYRNGYLELLQAFNSRFSVW